MVWALAGVWNTLLEQVSGPLMSGSAFGPRLEGALPLRDRCIVFLAIAEVHRPTGLWRGPLGVGHTLRRIRLWTSGEISSGRLCLGAAANPPHPPHRAHRRTGDGPHAA